MATRRTDPTPKSKATQSTAAKSPVRRTRRAKSKGNSAATGVSVTQEAREAMIAEAAYFHAERRGFAPGDDVQDWLDAEAEIDALLKAAAHGGRPQ